MMKIIKKLIGLIILFFGIPLGAGIITYGVYNDFLGGFMIAVIVETIILVIGGIILLGFYLLRLG